MTRTLKAAAAYFAAVFALGFVLGTVRVLWLIPKIGPVGAVLIEAPFMLTASWFVARRCVLRFGIGPGAVERLAMGLTAFGLLMAAEPLLSVPLFGQTPSQYLAGLATPAGLLGLLMQGLFGLIPYLQRPRRREP